MITTDTILEKLHENANPNAVDGMKKYGITPSEIWGVSIPILCSIASDALRQLRSEKVLERLKCKAVKNH